MLLFYSYKGELFDLTRFIYADCDCLLLLILFYWLFVIYVVRVLFLSHLFISSYEKLWRFQELTRLSLRLNHFCISDFKIHFQNER